MIPYYNDQRIERCVQSLINQRYPHNLYEVIIVDNNSTNLFYQNCIGRNIKVVRQPERGSYKSRNMGILNSKGEIVAFTDSDCTVDMDWLDVINRSFNDSSDLYAVQGLSLSNRMNYVSKAINELYEELFFDEIVDDEEKYCSRIDTRNCAVLRRCFDELGLFNDGLLYWGDAEYGKRIVEAGKKIKYLSNMSIVHSDICELELYMKKREKEGKVITNSLFLLGASYTKKYFPEMLFIFWGRQNTSDVLSKKIDDINDNINNLMCSTENGKQVVKALSRYTFLKGVYESIEKEKVS